MVLGSAADSDDVVQVASERAWRAIATVDARRSFRPWFLRIVANTARNQRRSGWRRQAAELRLAAQPTVLAAADPESSSVNDAEREVVIAAMNQLDADDRLVIALRHFEQLSDKEMAVVMACPAGTVKSRLSRAMSRLRAELIRREPSRHRDTESLDD